MKKIIIILIGLIFLGCSTEKKFQKNKAKAENFYIEYPQELAKICSFKFPVTEKYIPGKEIVKTDTITVIKKDLVYIDCEKQENKGKLVKCPDCKEIVRYVEKIRIDTIVKENTANVKVWENKSEEWRKKYDEENNKNILLNSKNRDLKRNLIILGIVLVLFISYRIYRFLK